MSCNRSSASRVALAVTQDAQAGPGPIEAAPLSPPEDETDDAGPRLTPGLILAGVAALAASAGLAWWVAAPDRGADVAAVPPPAPVTQAIAPAPAPLRFAAADPDPNQVRQAWADVRQAYVDGGADALVRASQVCAKGLPTAPQRLDYCLAYDRYAEAVAGAQADWFADSPARDLALARTALPEGVDAQNRIEQVGALTRAVLPKPKPRASRPKAPPAKAPHHAAARPKPVKAKAHAHRGVLGKQLRPAIGPPPADQTPNLQDWLGRAETGAPLEPPH